MTHVLRNTAPGTTLDAAVAQAIASGLDRLDAQWLLLHALGRSLDERAWLIAHGGDTVPADAHARYADLCARRRDAVPLAYLTGRRGFHGLELSVDARVLDPRPDTETLVDWALAVTAPPASTSKGTPRIVDLGTGSGAIALALKKHLPRAQVHAVDASADALSVAQANAQRLGLPLHLHCGSWWTPLAGLRFDLAVSNPPYIAEGDPHLPALRHEPMAALVAGPDGLADLRTIVAGAPAHLQPGGWLLLEHGHDQHSAVAQLLREAGLTDIAHRRDIAGIVRCTGGRYMQAR
ncbi:MAG: peptide chain release factor N(5)-glutamine methyltransferase [Burkholderiaceae bacterium]